MPKRKAFSINGEILTLDERARSAAPGKFIKLSKGFTHYELEGPQDGEPVALASGFSIPY